MEKALYSTRQVADMAGVHRDTLLRWLREGRIKEPSRDRNGWRVFTQEEIDVVLNYSAYNVSSADESNNIVNEPPVNYSYSGSIKKLQEVNWDFKESNTNYLTHSIHPYPAKFIPQIPKTLIRELASVGETVLDPFCGSGTTLVEAVRLECHAIGIDANPLSCLISKAKTAIISEGAAANLLTVAETAISRASEVAKKEPAASVAKAAELFKGVEEWFPQCAINELSYIKSLCFSLDDKIAQDIALTAFSSIIVTVSYQDSDTRYVRRDKKIKPGETLILFAKALKQAVTRILELNQEISVASKVRVINANILETPVTDKVDLVVCSPPYPNAFSYHLYHRTRMMWLEMDQPKFKKEEIGSHRKYSSNGKNAATVETFRQELITILKWLSEILKKDRFACFVIGDSTLKGNTIQNDQLLIKAAEDIGYRLEANINRNLLSTKKSFNPALGKIRDEHVVILRNNN